MVAAAAGAVVVGLSVLPVPADRRPPEPPAERASGRSGALWTAEPRARQVESLLRRRAEAIRTRDEAAFLSVVDPKAPAEFHERQLALFRSLEGVPLAEWSYATDFSDAARAPQTPVPADEVWAPRVTLNYALAEVDAVPTSRPMGYLFARRGDSWYLTADDALTAQGRRTWRGPWDFGATRVLTTGSGLVLSHDDNAGLADRVARVLDDSVRRVAEVWGPDWAQRAAVVLPSSGEELRALVGPEFAVDGIAAVAVADRVVPSLRRVEGQRVVLNARTAARLSDQALRVVLQHEITHVATRADTVDGAPMWMLEGFADYVGYRDSGIPPAQVAPDLARQVRAEGPPAGLPADRDFHLAGRRLDLAYQQSWSVVDHLARRLGERSVVRLYRGVAGSGSPSTVDAALREVAGVSRAELVTSWRADLHRAFG
ncbi:hypothetical protein GCM10010470_38440 [Saccharopolyspora taberi]|uniref:Uncharacterized protein n=1 Tax=Saccharopolyspora taberi TaxID=60895 RepID=A0ABN3VGV6_9PSEU